MKKNKLFRTALVGLGLTMGVSAWADIPADYTGKPFAREGSGTHVIEGTASEVPGSLNRMGFDIGGEGVSWHWTQDFNALSGNYWYRDDFACISSDEGGRLGWLADGNWITYTVNCTKESDYTVTAPNRDLALQVDLSVDYARTSGSIQHVHLTEGLHVLKFYLYAGDDYNADFTIVDENVPYYGAAFKQHNVPCRVEVEDFDLGGEGVAYHWGSGDGTTYRNDASFVSNIDSYSNGHGIGWRADGYWACYTLNVAEAGNYDIICDNPMNFEVRDANGGFITARSDFYNAHYDVPLQAGTNILKVFYYNHNQTSDYDYLDITKSDGKYKGTPHTELIVPGNISPINFDDGGRNISFHWNTDGGGDSGGRNYGVTNWIYNGFGWINNAGDKNWVTYTVYAAYTGNYTIVTKGPNGSDDTNTSIEVLNADSRTGTRTDGYTATHTGIALNEGLNVIKIYVGGGADLGNIYVTFEGQPDSYYLATSRNSWTDIVEMTEEDGKFSAIIDNQTDTDRPYLLVFPKHGVKSDLSGVYNWNVAVRPDCDGDMYWITSNTETFSCTTHTSNDDKCWIIQDGSQNALSGMYQISFNTTGNKVTCTPFLRSKLNANGLATVSAKAAKNMIVPEGVEVYTVNLVDETSAKLTKSEATILPKIGEGEQEHKGVLLQGEAGSNVDFFYTDDTASDLGSDNLLWGSGEFGWEAGTVYYDTSVNYYVLATVDGETAFHKVTSGTTIATHRAFLMVNANASKLAISFDDETPTAIEGISEAGSDNGAFYNLQGIRVGDPQKGIYIHNGKKVVLK